MTEDIDGMNWPDRMTRYRFALGLVVLGALVSTAAAGPDSGIVRYVTDGDTFRLVSGERIRNAGIDAPETHSDQAHCRAEMALGETAAARARGVLDGREVQFFRVGRSYNRTVARVTIDGRDVGSLFVTMGIARPWPRGTAKPDWCH